MAVNNIPLTPTELDKTNAYFNNFFLNLEPVSTLINDDMLMFFEEFTNDKEAAKILSMSIILTAKQQNLDIDQIINELKSLEADKINAYITLLLNMNRVSTSLLGIKNVPNRSQYVTRTVRP